MLKLKKLEIYSQKYNLSDFRLTTAMLLLVTREGSMMASLVCKNKLFFHSNVIMHENTKKILLRLLFCNGFFLISRFFANKLKSNGSASYNKKKVRVRSKTLE